MKFSITDLINVVKPSPASYTSVLKKPLNRGIPGLQAYIKKGDDVWVHALGLSNVESDETMRTTDLIRLASLTKLMTYALIHELEKEGCLHFNHTLTDLLDPDVIDGIPYAPEITVDQLLHHTSGIYCFNEAFFNDLFQDPTYTTRLWTPQELIGYAKKKENPPTSPPGEKVSYSNTGYILLGMIIEEVTSKSYHEAMREKIFTPLGIEDTILEGYETNPEGIVNSYCSSDWQGKHLGIFNDISPIRKGMFFQRMSIPLTPDLYNLSNHHNFYNAWAWSAGAYASNVHDLAKFIEAIYDNRITIIQNQEQALNNMKPGEKIQSEGGSWGIRTGILLEPARDITIILLFNGTNLLLFNGTNLSKFLNQLWVLAKSL